MAHIENITEQGVKCSKQLHKKEDKILGTLWNTRKDKKNNNKLGKMTLWLSK